MKHDMRRRLQELWSTADLDAKRLKDSQYAQDRLRRFVENLTSEERDAADEVLADWAREGDPRQQFDALSLIDELRINSAIPALQELAETYEASDAPSAPYDWAWVNRIIGHLSEDSPNHSHD